MNQGGIVWVEPRWSSCWSLLHSNAAIVQKGVSVCGDESELVQTMLAKASKHGSILGFDFHKPNLSGPGCLGVLGGNADVCNLNRVYNLYLVSRAMDVAVIG
jgi:hypothetical protein